MTLGQVGWSRLQVKVQGHMVLMQSYFIPCCTLRGNEYMCVHNTYNLLVVHRVLCAKADSATSSEGFLVNHGTEDAMFSRLFLSVRLFQRLLT